MMGRLPGISRICKALWVLGLSTLLVPGISAQVFYDSDTNTVANPVPASVAGQPADQVPVGTTNVVGKTSTESQPEPASEDPASQIRNRLKEVESGLADPGGEPETAARQLIKDTRQALDAADSSRKLFQSYRQSIGDYPDEKARLESEIQSRRSTAPSLSEPLAVGDGTDAISARLTARQSQLNTLKAELKQLEEQAASEVSRPTAIQKEIQDNKAVIDQNQKALRELESNGDTSPSGLRSQLMRARALHYAALNQKLTEELNTHPQRYELTTLQRQLKELQVQTLEAQIKTINELLSQAREQQARNLAGGDDTSKRIQNRVPAAEQIINKNNEYLTSNLEAVEELNRIQADNQIQENELEELSAELESLEKELAIGNADDILRQVLVERHQDVNTRLVSGFSIDELEEQLKKARLQRFRYEQALREINPGTPAFDEMISLLVPDNDDAAADTEALRNLFIKRKEILEVLEANQRDLQNSLEKKLSLARSHQAKLEEFNTFLNRHLMWVPTSHPIWRWGASLRDLPDSLRKFKDACMEVLIRFSSTSQIIEVVLWGLLSFAVSVFAFNQSRGWRERFEEKAQKVRRISTDKFIHTLQLLGSCAIYPLKWTAWLWALVVIFWLNARDLIMGEAISYGLLIVAIYWHWHFFLRWINAENGVGPIHFRWRGDLIGRTLSCFRWLVPVFCIFSFVVTVLEFYGDMVLRDLIAEPSLMICYLAYMIFFMLIPGRGGKNLQAFFDQTGVGWLQRFGSIWRWLFIMVPAVLFGLTAWGYHYAAVNLGLHSLFMLLWLGSGLILYFTGIRWFAVKERRVALEQAIERRRLQQSQQKSDDPNNPSLPPIPDESTEFDLSTVKDQTRGFIKSLFGIFMLIGLYYIWKQVFPALEFLDQVKLWNYKAIGDEGTEIIKYFTLFDAFLFLVIVFLTTAAARNMPGVIEITLLERLPLQAGVRYAITTVLQYVTVAVGIVILFKLLGFKFEQFGWILAALSLGLGFGLQEVVANFVCGILLLLERPIRVGDIVTVSGITGLVSKIRIRATTVTDWDRKEFVVPNKEFITGHILNWTLTNKLNRVVINVGIAYGSDIEKAIRVLSEIVRSHPNVLKDPEPMITFESFGDSSLNLVVRFFLPDLDRRLMVIHEVNTRIHDRFKQENIEIPFPQRDVHLYNMNPNSSLPLT